MSDEKSEPVSGVSDGAAGADVAGAGHDPGEVDQRRRAAIARLGRKAGYAVPVTLALMSMKRAAWAY